MANSRLAANGRKVPLTFVRPLEVTWFTKKASIPLLIQFGPAQPLPYKIDPSAEKTMLGLWTVAGRGTPESYKATRVKLSAVGVDRETATVWGAPGRTARSAAMVLAPSEKDGSKIWDTVS